MSFLRSIFAGIILLVSPFALGESLEGKVVAIADGDTITVLDAEHQQHRIRLAAIDAPERRQPFARRARQHLASVVFLQPARIEWSKHDRYGRIVGTVWVASPDSLCRGRPECPKRLDVGLYMLSVGLAWHYKRYAGEQTLQERERYAETEEAAHAKHRGLWMEAHPVAPWEWRKRVRHPVLNNRTRMPLMDSPGTWAYSSCAPTDRLVWNNAAYIGVAGWFLCQK